jgi:CheY-like chemotaxis protein
MPSVLIVDDLVSIHEMLDAVIQPTGFTTAFATDGEKGLARYKAEKFDLVLADIDMKPMDGITLLKQLKAYDPSCRRHHHDGLCVDGERGAGAEVRGVRLPAKTVSGR